MPLRERSSAAGRGGTGYDDAPEITILSSSIELPIVTIKYRAGYLKKGEPQLYAEIKFSDVLEYRWVGLELAATVLQMAKERQG